MLVGCTVEDIIQVRQSAIPSETTQAAFALLACQVGAASAAVSVSAPSASSFGTPHCRADHSVAVYADRAIVGVRLRTSRAGSAVCFSSDDSPGSAGLSQQAQHKKARAISALVRPHRPAQAGWMDADLRQGRAGGRRKGRPHEDRTIHCRLASSHLADAVPTHCNDICSLCANVQLSLASGVLSGIYNHAGQPVQWHRAARCCCRVMHGTTGLSWLQITKERMCYCRRA
jgi:hypothetical protein